MHISLVYTCSLQEADSRSRLALWETFCCFYWRRGRAVLHLPVLHCTETVKVCFLNIFSSLDSLKLSADLSILLLQNPQIILFTDGVFVLWCMEAGRASSHPCLPNQKWVKGHLGLRRYFSVKFFDWHMWKEVTDSSDGCCYSPKKTIVKHNFVFFLHSTINSKFKSALDWNCICQHHFPGCHGMKGSPVEDK